MPALMLLNNKANEELARLIAADNPGCDVQVDNWYVVIECPGELRVSAEHAWKAWAKTSIVQDPERFLWEWEALLRGCIGHIVRWTETEVVFSDNPPSWPWHYTDPPRNRRARRRSPPPQLQVRRGHK